jgi:hypothetical protein
MRHCCAADAPVALGCLQLDQPGRHVFYCCTLHLAAGSNKQWCPMPSLLLLADMLRAAAAACGWVQLLLSGCPCSRLAGAGLAVGNDGSIVALQC